MFWELEIIERDTAKSSGALRDAGNRSPTTSWTVGANFHGEVITLPTLSNCGSTT